LLINKDMSTVETKRAKLGARHLKDTDFALQKGGDELSYSGRALGSTRSSSILIKGAVGPEPPCGWRASQKSGLPLSRSANLFIEPM